jgi:hypothetical protein
LRSITRRLSSARFERRRRRATLHDRVAGEPMLAAMLSVTMPKKVVDDIEKVWARDIKDSSGKALYSAQ